MRQLYPQFIVLILLAAVCSSAQADIRILAITNAASFVPGLPSSGALASIFCTGLTGPSGVVASNSVPLALELDGVEVKVRGIAAPLLAVAVTDTYQQINIQVPWERPSGTLPNVEISQNGQSVRSADLSYYGSGAAFFADVQGYGIVQHSDDDSFVTQEHPARPGEVLVAWATGLGDVNPPVPTGYPAPIEPLSYLVDVFGADVSLGKSNANIWFRGLAPGKTGIYQINFQVPDSAPAGDLSLSFSSTQCPPFGFCGSPYFDPPVTTFGPSVKVPVR